MTDRVLEFLSGLDLNNNRDWFHANKEWYDEAKLEMEQLVGTIIPGIAGFDPAVQFVSAKECMFRIFRDIRFSKDKLPYKTNFGAWITRVGRKSCGPGYYIHIQPGESFLAAGVYMPEPEKLKNIRQEIYHNISEFKEILEGKELRKYVKGVDEMDRLKKPPVGFPASFPEIEILMNRHFTVSCPLSGKQLSDPTFPKFALKVFAAMHPFNVFLGRAINE